MNDASRPDATPLSVRFDDAGLVPVVAQDAATGEVLLVAYMNAEALTATLTTGDLTLWSRSRRTLWRKGATSGHTLRMVELRVNCEQNSLLARVELTGPGACHEGYRGCFYRVVRGERADALSAATVESRVFDPTSVYGVDGETAPREDTLAEALERDSRALYALYERLRDASSAPDSRTSALLHGPDRTRVSDLALTRAVEELAELRGVIAGTHRHSGDEQDVVLEASQVGYWVSVASVALGLTYDTLRPDVAWLAGWRGASTMRDVTAAAPLIEFLRAAGALCAAAGVHPARVVAADLAEMRARRGGQDGT